MARLIRVAIVVRQVQGLSGATTIILENARRLSALGWQVDVYGESLDRPALRSAGARARWVPGWPWGSYLKRRLFAELSRRAVSRGRYDLVHGHGDSLEQDVLSLHNCVHAAHEAVHGGELPRREGVGRIHEQVLSGRGFRRLIANSRLMREEVTRRFGVPWDRSVVIYPGHDPRRFRAQDRGLWRRQVRGELGFSEAELVFGLITSGDFVKRGVDTFLRALARLRLSSVKALVMGKETRLLAYQRLARDLGISAAVRFLPPTPQVERYYHALDVYVHPAAYEEFGMSVQEAMACGLPVIAGSRVGATELMAPEAREYLLERGGEEELCGKMSLLAAKQSLRRRLGELGPAAVGRNTWEANFRATLGVYQELLASEDRSGQKS